MNLGDRVSCGKLTPTHIGLTDRKVTEIIATALEADTIALGGTDLQTTLTALAGGSVTADWNNITNKPSNLVDWTVDQGDTNIDANNLPLLNYAPNTLASNGTAGLTNYNFNQARKDKLAGVESGAQVNVQTDWNASGTSAAILNKPTWIPSSNPGYLTAVPSAVTDAIALNTAKVTYPGPPSWNEVTSKPALQEAITGVPTHTSSTFGGATYLFGGLDLTSGTLTYIPPPLSVYAPLASPTFTGTVNLPSTTLIGSVSSTELGHLNGVTSAIQTQLNGKQSLGSYQTALETPVVASASGTGNLTLTSNAGYNTLLTFTPPNLLPYAPLASPIFTGSVAVQYSLTAGQHITAGAGYNITAGDVRIRQYFGASVTNTNAGAASDYFVRQDNAGITHMRSKYGSNIYMYTVSGFPDVVINNYNVTVTGTLTQNSDDRLKFNEQPITDGLAVVRLLVPQSYEKSMVLNDTSGTRRHELGIIAQELLQIPQLAHAVHQADANSPYSVDYSQVFVYCLAAIKELDSQVQTLKARLAGL